MLEGGSTSEEGTITHTYRNILEVPQLETVGSLFQLMLERLTRLEAKVDKLLDEGGLLMDAVQQVLDGFVAIQTEQATMSAALDAHAAAILKEIEQLAQGDPRLQGLAETMEIFVTGQQAMTRAILDNTAQVQGMVPDAPQPSP